MAETADQARVLLRRLSKGDEAARAVDAARAAVARYPADAGVLLLALTIFEANALAEDRADAAAAMLALSPTDPAVVGRCLYGLHEAGRPDEAAAAAAGLTERAAHAALARPGVSQAVARLPHLAAYYDRGHQQQWLPYVMMGGPVDVRTDVLHTDSSGYRWTIPGDGSHFAPRDDTAVIGNAAMVGASTVFGVGASDDAHTLPSLLCTDRWRYYNLGSRAYVLAQNTVAMLFDMPRLAHIRRIVILAGWNDLHSLENAVSVPRDHGVFSGWNRLCRLLNPIVAHYPVQDWPTPVRMRYSTAADRGGSLAYDEMLQLQDTMLGAWRMYADTLGAELIYVLQPVRDWIERCAPAEETELCNLLVGEERLADLSELATSAGPWFRDGLSRLCEAHRIRFIDANRLFQDDPQRHGWLFVDPAHLTDLGHQALAVSLQREIDHD